MKESFQIERLSEDNFSLFYTLFCQVYILSFSGKMLLHKLAQQLLAISSKMGVILIIKTIGRCRLL